jgi:hypothetical protein
VGVSNLFLAFNRFGPYQRGFYQHEHTGFVRTDLFKGFRQTVSLRMRTFQPVFNFGYYTNPDQGPASVIRNEYNSTELVFESRYAPDEVLIQNDFKMLDGRNRGRRGIPKWPVFTFRYSLGLRALEGDFRFHRFQFGIQHSVRAGVLGRTYYNVTAGFTPSRVPYPLLFPHLGNNTAIYTDNAFNMMSIGEFVSTRYAALRVRHDLEGFLFNRLPLFRKWKWRTDLLANVLYGENDKTFNQIHPKYDHKGNPLLNPYSLDPGIPYVEVGYGINNIFKFLRVEFLHRLTYLDQPTFYRATPRPFAIKLAAQFRL